MPKRIAIVQSSYIPWKGYFDLIRCVDEFILFDSVQYTKRDWRNRNLIKTPRGTGWLTVPVEVKGRFNQRICDTTIAPDHSGWTRKHWHGIESSYAKAPHFAEFKDRFKDVYEQVQAETHLSRVNHAFLVAICGALGIRTKISWSMDYGVIEGRNERLIDLCRKAGGTEYLSGPSARAYMDLEVFKKAGLTVRFADYSRYREYPQLYPPFTHGVSALDLIFQVGAGAPGFLCDVAAA